MPFRGPSARRYISPDVSDNDYGRAINRAAGGVARIDTSYMEEQNRQKERKENAIRENIMTPGVRRATTPAPFRTDFDPSLPKPEEFEQAGERFVYDPSAASALDRAANAGRLRETAKVNAEQDQAEETRRIRNLIQSGLSERDATRQVYGRGGLGLDEQRELIEARGSEQRERDEALQSQIRERQTAAQAERNRLSLLLEASRSGDREADRALRAQVGLVATYDRELDDIERARKGNAINADPMATRLMDSQSLDAARQHLADLDAREEAARLARETARGGVQGAVKAPAAGGAPEAARPAALSIDDRIRAARGGGANPGGAPAATPPAGGAAAGPKKSLADRTKELKAQGMSRDQAIATLLREGYKLDQD